jgi:glutamate racemase
MRVGIFDSGRGGALAFEYFRTLAPSVDTVLHLDVENAPDGTKNTDELITAVRGDIDRLRALGCSRVLMACCTASTVFPLLPQKYREGTVPIIEPVARAAAGATKNGCIAVISTEATKRSGAFVKAIGEVSGASVSSYASGALVTLSELYAEKAPQWSTLYRAAEAELVRVLESGADTLVLGCTHFSAFYAMASRITGMTVIDSARIGAASLYASIAAEI